VAVRIFCAVLKGAVESCGIYKELQSGILSECKSFAWCDAKQGTGEMAVQAASVDWTCVSAVSDA